MVVIRHKEDDIVMLAFLGITTFVLFLLAATNGLKRYVKHPAIRALAKNHRLFGMLAAGVALIHMIVAVAGGNLRVSGLFALLGVVATGALGTAVYKLKNKRILMIHRIVGPLTLLLMIIHVIVN